MAMPASARGMPGATGKIIPRMPRTRHVQPIAERHQEKAGLVRCFMLHLWRACVSVNPVQTARTG
jgi:hypothetical protein